jgi:hypothetical protein
VSRGWGPTVVLLTRDPMTATALGAGQRVVLPQGLRHARREPASIRRRRWSSPGSGKHAGVLALGLRAAQSPLALAEKYLRYRFGRRVGRSVDRAGRLVHPPIQPAA